MLKSLVSNSWFITIVGGVVSTLIVIAVAQAYRAKHGYVLTNAADVWVLVTKALRKAGQVLVASAVIAVLLAILYFSTREELLKTMPPKWREVYSGLYGMEKSQRQAALSDYLAKQRMPQLDDPRHTTLLLDLFHSDERMTVLATIKESQK